jgi:HTH-type transcriptional regulator / antitoxin HigA
MRQSNRSRFHRELSTEVSPGSCQLISNEGANMARRSPQKVQQGKEENYLKFVRVFRLRPVRSESELDRAIEVIDSLVIRDHLDSGQEDYLDVLGDLVHKYEADHEPIAAVSDADMVRFLLESSEMAQAELAKQSGVAESTISEILAGKRKLSRRHIAGLSRVFHVSPAVFFPEAVEMTTSNAEG